MCLVQLTNRLSSAFLYLTQSLILASSVLVFSIAVELSTVLLSKIATLSLYFWSSSKMATVIAKLSSIRFSSSLLLLLLLSVPALLPFFLPYSFFGAIRNDPMNKWSECTMQRKCGIAQSLHMLTMLESLFPNIMESYCLLISQYSKKSCSSLLIWKAPFLPFSGFTSSVTLHVEISSKQMHHNCHETFHSFWRPNICCHFKIAKTRSYFFLDYFLHCSMFFYKFCLVFLSWGHLYSLFTLSAK